MDVTTLTQAEYDRLKPFLDHLVPQDVQASMNLLRSQGLYLALAILRGQPASRPQSLALTQLEETMMRAIQGLAMQGTPMLPHAYAVETPPVPEEHEEKA